MSSSTARKRPNTSWMDEDNERERRFSSSRPVENRGLYLRRLRTSNNRAALENCTRPDRQRRIVAYALTRAGGSADEDLSTVRRLIEEKDYAVAHELTDTYAPHSPCTRPGYAEARRLVWCGFADGIAVVDRQAISAIDDEYEHELRWYAERPALVLLHTHEAAP